MPSTAENIRRMNETTRTLIQGTSFYDDSMDYKHFQVSKHRQLKKYDRLAQKSQKMKQRYIRKKVLQDIGLTLNSTPSSEWICGVPIGSRSAVLVFKTVALTRHICDDDDTDDGPNGSNSSNEKCRFPPVVDPKQPSSNSHSIPVVKRMIAPSFDIYRENTVKNSVSVSSSSENSISSACEDPSDLEAAMAKAEKITTAEEVEHESKGESPTRENEQNIDDTDVVDDMPAAMLQMTYKFTNTETKLLKRILSSHGLREAKECQKFNLLWTGLHMKPDILRSLLPHQRVNHFPRSYELTRKDRLYKNIEKMQQLRGMRHFDIVPLSFMLPLEYRDLVQAHRTSPKGCTWIVKPTASSRGRGIYLISQPEQIPSEDQVIVSKYISDPLCIDEHKCDVRLYVLVTSFDPLVIYLYEEGLVRLATVKYDKTVENLWNPCMHLCNYSINKYHLDYIKATESDEDVGHKWSFSALLRHLKSQGNDTTSLMQAIEDVIIKSIFACSQSIVSACKMFVPNQNNCFELYGFDILIDNTLKPWLLEVNLSPSLGIDTPLDTRVKSAMLTDLLTLVGLPAQGPQSPITRNAPDPKFRFKGASSTLPTSSRRRYTDMKTTTGYRGVKRLNLGLSAEEIRILKSVRAQNSRRGGFVRIFPTSCSMQRFGQYLDQQTGIPMSMANGISMAPILTIHNYNLMLHSQLYNGLTNEQNDLKDRMKQYERTLPNTSVDQIFKNIPVKTVQQAQLLRKQLQRAMENGGELTLLQTRKFFSLFLESVLKRLTVQNSHGAEPRNYHEKLILKFITRSDLTIKPPAFMKNPNSKVPSKDRPAIIAKLLSDYIEAFDRDTDLCVDNYSYYGLIPSQLFDDFISQATESDLEFILTLHVNLTQNLAFLYNRCMPQSCMPTAPLVIPSGNYGFLKALPSLTPNISTRDIAQIESYYRSLCPISSGMIDRDISYDNLEKMTTNRNTSLHSVKKRTSVA